jgi:hypothetical protein
MCADDREQLLDVRIRLIDEVARGHRPRFLGTIREIQLPRFSGLDRGGCDVGVEAEFAVDRATGKPNLVGVALVPIDRAAD